MREDLEMGLKLFNEKARRLERLTFTKSVFEEESGLKIIFKPVEPPTVERKGPDEEAIEAFVLTFRFFVQDREPSSFRNIAETYRNLPVSQEKKDSFRGAYEKFNEFLNSKYPIKINDRSLTHWDILDIFIYGWLSHAHREKKEIFAEWMSDPIANQLMKNALVYVLGNTMKYIRYIKNLNETVLEELNRAGQDEN